MKSRTRKLFAACLLPGFIGAMAYPSIWDPPQVEAATSQPLSLTYQKMSDTQGVIRVTFGAEIQSVLLPNGTKVTTSGTTFTVQKNGTYDFVAYSHDNRPTQQSVIVSDLNVDHAPLFTAHGLYIKLHVDAFDTISEVDAYRYKLDDANSWSSWIPYHPNNTHEIQIPATSLSSSFIEERSVQVEVKDHAGNIRKTETSFRVDHAYPELQTNNETIYTNTGTISLPLVTTSYFKSPERLIVKEGTKVTHMNLNDYAHSETLMQIRPNQYKADWKNNLTYSVDRSFQGLRQIELVAVKTHRDYKGNTINLSSNDARPTYLNVVYDTVKPTGSAIIRANGKNEVPSHEVTLDLRYEDDYGIKSVRVYEKGTSKEYYLTPSEIQAGRVSLPWTLSIGKDGQVFMDITDNAGNTATFASNKVTISNLVVTGFELTDVVNPAVRFPNKGYKWQFDGNQVYMIAGGNFTFKVYYDIGYVDPSRYDITGRYKVTIVDGGSVVYESEPIAFNSNDQPIGEHFDSHNPMMNRGFETTFTLPKVDHKGRPFHPTAKVYISIELQRYEKADGSILKATFEQPNTLGNLIGRLDHYDGAVSIEDMVRFNEKH